MPNFNNFYVNMHIPCYLLILHYLNKLFSKVKLYLTLLKFGQFPFLYLYLVSQFVIIFVILSTFVSLIYNIIRIICNIQINISVNR